MWQEAITLHEEITFVRNFTSVSTSDAKKEKGQLAEGRGKNKFLPSGAAKPQ